MIAKDLKSRRKELGLTQKSLLKETKLSLPTIGQLEKGGGTISSLEKLLNALNCEVFSIQLENTGTVGERVGKLRKKKKIINRMLLAAKLIGRRDHRLC